MDSQDYAEILKARREKMMDYLRLKVEVGDWHGVAGAAMDLRDIENELVLAQIDKKCRALLAKCEAVSE